MYKQIYTVLLLLFIFFAGNCSFHSSKKQLVPVIYVSDLFHPHGDMDDQVDLVAIYSLQNIDLKAIILESGKFQKTRPGAIPVSQLNYITGKDIHYSIGSAIKLKSPTDKCLYQPEEFQAGIKTILTVLKNSENKITIVTVGSLRDVAAAYNRNMKLFHEKVEKLLIFAGEASKPGYIETNVKLDPNAFIRIMRSGLPIFWVPCFDGGLWQNNGHASYWQTSYKNILKNASNRIIQYFLYAFTKSNEDPIEYLNQDTDPLLKKRLFSKIRNLWCCSVFIHIIGKTVAGIDRFKITRIDEADERKFVFKFSPALIKMKQNGEVIYTTEIGAQKIMRFEVLSKKIYRDAMVYVASNLLSSL